MNPKDYFKKNFSIKETVYDFSSKQEDEMKKAIIHRYNNNLDEENTIKTNEYSNDPIFNSLIQDLFEFIGAPKDTVYIGKITNSYPNCYMISKDNNESLDGCLICITTGLTDNSYAFSEYLSLLRFIDIERLQENQYIDYLNILTFDIVNRIKNKYGDEFATSDLVQIADLTINEYWFQDFQIMASNISYCIDFFAVLHEYVHYLINSFSNNKNSYISKLIIQTVSLYAKFCEINPKIKHLLPQNEVVADLGALLILHDFFQFNEEMVCSVILAVKQLERMSSQDDYTNHYRTKIVEFFLNELNISQTPVVKNRISRIYNLFILADDSEVQLSKMKKLAY